MPMSPAVRKLVSEHNLDPAAITGTGKDGRLVKAEDATEVLTDGLTLDAVVDRLEAIVRGAQASSTPNREEP